MINKLTDDEYMLELRQKKDGCDMPHMSIYFSTISYNPQTTIFQKDFKTDLEEVITPVKEIVRYSRLWRFSKPIIQDRYILGKLGYTALGTERKANYDEKIHDFVEQTVSSEQSTFVFWVIDLPSRTLGFEIKPPDIKYQSFYGAFQGFLDERPDINLTLNPITEKSKFIEWVNSVDRVIKFKAKLRSPNPDYSKHPKIIQELLERTNADKASLELDKIQDSEESLDTEETIEDIVKYGESGYSSIFARGKVGDQTKEYDSRRRLPMERISVSESIDDEAKWGNIIKAIRSFRNES